jgi:hypothetical protein
MKKALLALAAVAVIFTACGSSTDTPSYDAPDPVISNNVIADIAWDSLSSTDQAGVCLAVSDGVQSYEVDAFVDGADNTVSEQEALLILRYIAAEKC